jgi:hypothetical protein
MAQPNTTFRDRTADLGLQIKSEHAAWADVDNDGWVDLCLANGIWRNDAGKRFTRIADVPVTLAADFDNDGFVDVFSATTLQAFRNIDGRSWVELKLPDLPKCVSRGACCGDFNGDGLVDLYIGGYEDWDADVTYPSFFLMNVDGKQFRMAATDQRFRARGATACDFDRDGDLDVYVSNYRLQPNCLWINDGTGTFKDVADEYGVVAASPGFDGAHSIGAVWGDFNNDGLIDLFAGNFAHIDSRGDQPQSRFFQSLGPTKEHRFRDMGTCGVRYQESYASPSAGDYDNDGDLDLFFTTVYATASLDKKNYPVLFRQDDPFEMTDITAVAGLAGLGPTYQAAWADYDNDGDLDLVTDERLFENQGTDNGWLRVRLTGDGDSVNRSAIGAEVRIALGDATLTRQVEAGTGEGNQNELTLHFGLGQHQGYVDLDITWPNGTRQTVTDVRTRRIERIRFATSR